MKFQYKVKAISINPVDAAEVERTYSKLKEHPNRLSYWYFWYCYWILIPRLFKTGDEVLEWLISWSWKAYAGIYRCPCRPSAFKTSKYFAMKKLRSYILLHLLPGASFSWLRKIKGKMIKYWSMRSSWWRWSLCVRLEKPTYRSTWRSTKRRE